MLQSFKSIPSYLWTLFTLVAGITFGGMFPDGLSFIANGTTSVLKVIILLVPLLIFAALSPSIASLIKRGQGGKFAFSVILWYILSSALAGLFGLVVSSLIFNIPFSVESEGALTEASKMLVAFSEQSGASLPLISIVSAVAIGIIAVKFQKLYDFLMIIERSLHKSSSKLSVILIPIVFCLGISIGVNFGVRVGMGHYIFMSLYTMLLCFGWFLFYSLVILKLIAKKSFKDVVRIYYLPTAIFSAAACSSLVALPVNIANADKFGVRKEVSDFIIPFGAVVNMDASTLAYVAYAPFVLSYIFGIQISWTVLLTAWPAIVLFTIAAPGLPAGIGTALWSSSLFASMLNIEEPARSTFVATWIALAGGLPDMFRTATNCTGDGFTAIFFDTFFDKFKKK